MKALHYLVAWIGCLALPTAALAGTMDYQGYFEDNGMPIEGEHALRFTFWTAPVGGDSLWSETQNAVPFDRGLFSVKLGSTHPLAFVVFQQPEVYLEVVLDGGAFTTRTKLGSVPYAFLADLATEATHAGTADFAAHAAYADSAGSGASGGDAPWPPPIGTILPFYDFGTDGPGGAPLTFDSTYWCFCDGRTTPLQGVGTYTTPDLSNRYLVGFGTEASGDMDTAAWATAPVGAASHQVDVSHTHGMQNHTHTGPSHTHTGPSHTHQQGGWFACSTFGDPNTIVGMQVPNQNYGAITRTYLPISIGDATTHIYSAVGFDTGSGGTGNTGAGGTGATGAPSNNTTTSGGSSSQTIQPRSIRVRFIMRIK